MLRVKFNKHLLHVSDFIQDYLIACFMEEGLQKTVPILVQFIILVTVKGHIYLLFFTDEKTNSGIVQNHTGKEWLTDPGSTQVWLTPKPLLLRPDLVMGSLPCFLKYALRSDLCGFQKYGM